MNEAIEKKEITRKGQRALEDMVLRLKVVAAGGRARQMTYQELSEWVTARTGIEVNKDEFWRTCTGSYKTSPSSMVLAALAQVPEFTFLDEKTRPTMDQLMELLLGVIDGYGQPTKTPAE